MMKTTKPKLSAKVRTKETTTTKVVSQTTFKGGIKEQVKAGLLTAKQALINLDRKGEDAKYSNTFRWLQARASKESTRKEANIEAQG